MITAVISLLHFIFGLATGFIGAIMPALMDGFSINMVQGSYVLAMINTAGIASVFLVFVLGDRVNKFVVIGAALALFTVSLFGAAMASTYRTLLLVFLVFGLGIKTLDTMNNAAVSDIHGDKRGMYLNIMHAAFSVGALSSPQFVFLIERNNLSWNAAFLYFGLCCSAALVLYVVVVGLNRHRLPKTAGRNTDATGAETAKSLLEIAKSPKLWVLTLVFFCFFGVIATTNTWLVYHMQKTVESTLFISKSAVTIFWIGVLVSRTLLAPLAMKHGGLGFVRMTAILSAIVYTVALVVGNGHFILASVFLSGLTAGQIAPFVIADSCAIFPNRSASVSALLFLVAYIAQVFFPWISGVLGEQFGSRSTMMIVPLSFMMISISTSIVVKMKSEPLPRASGGPV